MSLFGGTSHAESPCDVDKLVEVLHKWQGEILVAYERRLTGMGSPLVHSPVVRDQCLRHAAEILADVATRLRAGDLSPAGEPSRLAHRIGAARAAERIHPNESLRAATELFDVTLSTVCGLPECKDLPVGAVVAFALALNLSIGRRIHEAASSYAGFLLERIREAYVDERRRIAREIHDRVAQNLVVADRSLELYVDDDPSRAERRLTIARSALSQTIASIRDVASDLRLVRPEEGLDRALRGYLDTVAAGDIELRFAINGEERWVSPDVRDQVVLVVREAIRNAVTHGRPSALEVRIDIAPHELQATVDDDGVGIDLLRADGGGERAGDGVGRAGGGAGSGLASMQERVELLGGLFTVASAPGQGTHIELLVPLERPTHGDFV